MRSYLALSQLTIATTRLLPWRTHSCVPRRHSCRRPLTRGEEASRKVSTLHARVRAPRSALALIALLAAPVLCAAAEGVAATPPMGWNSWDCYGTTVTEAEVKANADYMAST